ncbi:hypothetical protein GCM10023196_007350 [Actinoallomurus vinaceus]|uniref:Uncharacterized protein n=1 Tax=Actinoallomurus vinaceus TaxID=1080074 RepID=A0ABP8U2W1_9ACTN
MNPPELTPEARLMRSIDDFRRALYGRRTIGVLRIADLAHLRVLIDRYPAEAREMLDHGSFR